MLTIKTVTAMLLMLLVLAGCSQQAATDKPAQPPRPAAKTGPAPADTSPQDDSTTVKVFFANQDGDKLVAETRSVGSTDDLPKAVLEELVRGPRSQDDRATLPSGTRVLGVEVKDGVAYADFSGEFVTNHPGGSSGEIATVYSVVNSLCELPGITKVGFKIDGKSISLLKGQLDLSEPLEPDLSLVESE